ncbi:cellulose synthase/poly-beta-1,6-N-acetylglucosamine synthase-like glycosyltransferase [Bacillus tianshenii]|uniref:Cellulose synthase/poly-beta-1,6-N-acetylglucosamine synthase-like glycosyltransferase n=1 Tax=Sutcliffiella tianshenii TaxID=1463404 RepID=A0ABS2P6S3_9BACI|nr:glycosyltransferase family 2 protein [Bacillus tianshenii]MBM7622115.1 cellulose synthase/poly-beta-1,6-N-acetylglucosamine synthase-like glycosyltransferase [Bacillus tianshenii]
MIYLAAFTCLFWLIVWVDASIGMNKITKLEQVPIDRNILENGPLLSIIVAARDEEEHIKASLQSQFSQSYPNIEWIVVNDRSTDKTKIILDQMARTEPRMNVIHVSSLPSGWLGKNHALLQGFLASRGELILFTDADIYYEKDTITKALSYLHQEKLDHLTLAPNLKGKGYWTNAFVAFFLFGFSYFKRPWKSNDPKSKTAIGIGAFNLLTREAYLHAGTHEQLKMRPDDDLILGQEIKRAGKKQHLALAQANLSVEWYPSLKSALIGLEKNTFAGLFYSYLMVLIAVCGLFISQVWPYLALFLTDGSTRVLYAISIVTLFLSYNQTADKMTKGANKYFISLPFTAVLFIYSIIRATILTAKRGGIIWRGTFYSLEELKK